MTYFTTGIGVLILRIEKKKRDFNRVQSQPSGSRITTGFGLQSPAPRVRPPVCRYDRLE